MNRRNLDAFLAFMATSTGRRLLATVVGIALAVAGVTAAYVLEIPNPSGGPPLATVTLGGPHATPTTEVKVPEGAVASAGDVGDHEQLRSETPEGVPGPVLERAREYEEQLAANDQLPIVTPAAAPQQRGCTTKLVQNYSSRRGVAPREEVVHYTVSRNVPGWSDVYAIAGLFDRPSFAASSNYIIDGEGHCLYIVRESDKAWTQAAANPFSVSVEVINSGSEPRFMAPAGLQKLAMVLSDAADRWKIPIQPGVVVNCIPRTPGILDHASLGACGGGHHDIHPYRIAEVVAAVKAFRSQTPPKNRPAVYRVTYWKPGGKQRFVVTATPGRRVGIVTKRGFTRVKVSKEPVKK